MNWLLSAIGGVLLIAAPRLGAEGDAPESGPVKATVASPVAPDDAIGTPVACVVHAHESVDPDSSRAVAEFVCSAFRRHGVPVGPVAPQSTGASSAYVVRLEWIGSAFELEVAYEEPPGNVRRVRRATFIDFSEAASQGDGLALALLTPDAEPKVQPPPGPLPDKGYTIDGWIGTGATVPVDGQGRQGLTIGLTALVQYKRLDAGLGFSMVGARSDLFGALAGVSFDPVPAFRCEALMEGGMQLVTSVGDSGLVFSSNRSAILPYVGGRAGASFLPGRAHHFLIGLWASAGTEANR